MSYKLFSSAEILIAEDNPLNYSLLKELVNLMGAKEIWAKNGREVLECLDKHKNISLILMDIDMPEMDGIVATKKIRERKMTIPVIFQTAYDTKENRNECNKAGGNELISKPVSMDLLYSVLKKYL